MTTMHRKHIIYILFPVLLSACSIGSSHERDFECQAIAGSPCQTIAAADGSKGGTARLVTPAGGNTVDPYNPPNQTFRGKLGFGKPANNNATGVSNPERPTRAENARLGLRTDRNLPASRYNAAAQRVPERVGTLWVASYLDEDNILHDASYVHFVIREAGWANVSP